MAPRPRTVSCNLTTQHSAIENHERIPNDAQRPHDLRKFLRSTKTRTLVRNVNKVVAGDPLYRRSRRSFFQRSLKRSNPTRTVLNIIDGFVARAFVVQGIPKFGSFRRCYLHLGIREQSVPIYARLSIFYPTQYEYAAVIKYNWSQVRYRGAGIFLHVNGSGATGGCVSVPRWMMIELFSKLDPAKKPVIAIGA